MKTLLPVLASLFLAFPARAELPTLSADVGAVATVVPARQLDLVATQDHLAALHVGAGVSVGVTRGFLDVDLAYASTGTDAAAHGTVSASLWLRGVELGARYRYVVKPWLNPYLRLAGGWEWGTLTLLNQAQLTQTVGNPQGTALAGVQFPIALEKKAERAVQLVLEAGVGYTFRPGYHFDAMGPKPPATKPEDPLARGTIDVGTMPLSGLAYRLTLSLRY